MYDPIEYTYDILDSGTISLYSQLDATNSAVSIYKDAATTNLLSSTSLPVLGLMESPDGLTKEIVRINSYSDKSSYLSLTVSRGQLRTANAVWVKNTKIKLISASVHNSLVSITGRLVEPIGAGSEIVKVSTETGTFPPVGSQTHGLPYSIGVINLKGTSAVQMYVTEAVEKNGITTFVLQRPFPGWITDTFPAGSLVEYSDISLPADAHAVLTEDLRIGDTWMTGDASMKSFPSIDWPSSNYRGLITIYDDAGNKEVAAVMDFSNINSNNPGLSIEWPSGWDVPARGLMGTTTRAWPAGTQVKAYVASVQPSKPNTRLAVCSKYCKAKR